LTYAPSLTGPTKQNGPPSLWRAAVAFDNDASARDSVGAPIIRIIRIEIRAGCHHANEPILGTIDRQSPTPERRLGLARRHARGSWV